MGLKKNLIGHTWKSRKGIIKVTEENIEDLKKAGADVFEKEDTKKPRLKKYKGVKKDDVSNTEK